MKKPKIIDASELDVPLPEKIEKCGLTMAQKEKWKIALSGFHWQWPGFHYLLSKMLVQQEEQQFYAIPTKSVPIAATDGENLLINPDALIGKGDNLEGGFTLPQIWFVIGHEIGHNMLNDVNTMHMYRMAQEVVANNGKRYPYHHKLFNVAADYRLNAALYDSKIGKPPPKCCFDLQVATADDSLCDVYAKLYEDMEANGRINGADGNFDILLPPGMGSGKDPQEAANARDPAQWEVEIQQTRNMEERHCGNLPGGVTKLFDLILNPSVYWLDHIQAEIRKLWGSGALNWKRPERRWVGHDVFIPSTAGNRAGWVFIGADGSGSINDPELEQYLGELKGIMEECNPQRLTVAWWDTKIARIDELADPADLERIKAEGVNDIRGGTDIHPLFKWINEQWEKPNLVIIFTDGEFAFPPEPTFNLIWASVRDTEYPYGKVVRIYAKKQKP